MKLTLSWLEDFVDLPTDDPSVIARAFESLGLEVDEMRAIEAQFSGVVIGKVETVGPHPDADNVRLCQVDIGSGELSEIVCGAWNFEAGATVPVAVPGAVLDGGFEIGRRKIRGVVSNGMICSEKELGLGDDAAGIMVLDEDYPDAPEMVGNDFAELLTLPDTYFEIAITANRPDCMSVVGLARELAAYFDVPLRAPSVDLDDGGQVAATSVTIEDVVACPRFIGRELRGVAVGPSPHWLRARLAAAGVRPISNVVDASNYVMIELGHPTHAFDLDRLGDTIIVRRANADEQIVTLDEVERTLIPDDIVVADASRSVAVAGVMGGADTEVHDGTTRLLIEAAYWDPPSILHTSKRLGLRSEASSRFERGMDPNFCRVAADRVAELLVGLAGAEVGGLADTYPTLIEPKQVRLPLAEIPRVLGIEFSSEVASQLLTRLQFDVAGSDPLVVTVPTRRPDVGRPVDLIEELARLHGFDAIPDSVATGPGGGLPAYDAALRMLRSVLVGAGYYEAMTFSFVGSQDLDALELPPDDPRRQGIKIVNPLREEEGVMRTTLLAGLLKSVANNVGRHIPDVALFEIGKVFIPGAGKLPEQPDRLGFVAVGARGGGWHRDSWHGDGESVDLYDATGVWELVAHELRLPNPSVRRAQAAPFHPERSAEALVNGTVVGVVGEIHPSVAARFGLKGRVVCGELELDLLLMERDLWTFTTPSPYPPVVFDLAFDVDDEVPANTLLRAVDAAAGPMLEIRDVFDVFAGAPLEEGRKSVAVRLTFRAPDRTLKEDEVSPIRREIVDAVASATGGSLRGEL